MAAGDTARRVTAADIARSLGISRATVGFVLNDTPGQTISARTRERVLAEARRLGYRPHSAARALATGQTRIILLVLPDWPIEYSLGTHLDEASLTLDEAGYSLVTWTPHATGRARPLWETLQPDVVMSLVPFTEEQAETIRRSGAEVVTHAANSPALEYSQGPALQVEHLAERGHRKVAFAATSDPRLRELCEQRSALAAATAARLGIRLEQIVVRDEDVARVVQRWRARGVTAVAAYNDTIAALVVGGALRQGIAVPGGLAVIGHDESPIARMMVPSLSTVHVDTAGLGRYVAALALHAATGAPAPQAGPETRARLIARESS
jgi:DNA-binding LacI/PurR family transcriptional regulator